MMPSFGTQTPQAAARAYALVVLDKAAETVRAHFPRTSDHSAWDDAVLALLLILADHERVRLSEQELGALSLTEQELGAIPPKSDSLEPSPAPDSTCPTCGSKYPGDRFTDSCGAHCADAWHLTKPVGDGITDDTAAIRARYGSPNAALPEEIEQFFRAMVNADNADMGSRSWRLRFREAIAAALADRNWQDAHVECRPHMLDLYKGIGVAWGSDPFPRLAEIARLTHELAAIKKGLLWLNGEDGPFVKPDAAGPYWFRSELRRRIDAALAEPPHA